MKKKKNHPAKRGTHIHTYTHRKIYIHTNTYMDWDLEDESEHSLEKTTGLTLLKKKSTS